MRFTSIVLATALMASATTFAHADQLDDIISAGKLRCAVELDFPPNGARDKDNKPIGFDVDYCNDLAKALGVEAEIVDTPDPDRIPAVLSGRADIGIAVASDTLERAKTIGFSIPYFVFTTVILAREDSGIKSAADMKGHTVGGPAGAYETLALGDTVKSFNDPATKLLTFQSQSDAFLALGQKQIDATYTTSTIATHLIQSGKYPGLKIVGDAPVDADYCAILVQRQEQGLLNYVNLFLNRQVRSGRYAELYAKWVGTEGGPAPDLTVAKAYR
ncbi:MULTISPECIES: transporter substrate-binding domain-containing protein [Rhizobium/Agrobacterium group]|uniref:transporter substrate-binding domain-containing protein n=1 Tax=Rhizobium/Agrobacterium group TaxID=227290 RepID=UPI0008DC041D|nr:MULTISPECIES: transporter substrate-binding domain-containing protein [Rhizobium/Agrobacterium group]MCF1436508.1 transporter substrate-binding domain-containing protein [Allorhizobium ampelinum]MCF1464473.1 transporter substrate-binding domain-containing protein [Allorhizobium ampelinum]MCF1495841.1 transporter substrate-binding domain-containing protein [Allorhizobium ampelinum]MUO91207.1 transporter substrate-binding domain-containing protein [Agrobacterium vitis]MUZ54280.1 transporter s